MRWISVTVVLSVAWAALLGFGCKQPAPPVDRGKCRVMSYEGPDPLVRSCVYEGYIWSCVGERSCTRGNEVDGEAVAPNRVTPIDAPRDDGG